MAISGFIFLVSLIEKESKRTIEIGDVFGSSNPGRGSNPREKPRPFVTIFRVEEIINGKARLSVRYMHMDGKHHSGERWEDVKYTGTLDTKLN